MGKNKNKKPQPDDTAYQVFMEQTLGFAIEDVMRQQGFQDNAVIQFDAGADLLTVAFPLSEQILGLGLIGTKFYSYTVELKCSDKVVSDKVISPYGQNPKSFVVGLVNTYDTINSVIGNLKKGNVTVDLGVAVPAGQTNGLIRYVVVKPMDGLAKSVPANWGIMPQQQPQNYDMSQQPQPQNYDMSQQPPQQDYELPQTGVLDEESLQNMGTNFDQQLLMGNIGPMGVNQSKGNTQLRPDSSPYENPKAVTNYNFDPYADNNN